MLRTIISYKRDDTLDKTYIPFTALCVPLTVYESSTFFAALAFAISNHHQNRI